MTGIVVSERIVGKESIHFTLANESGDAFCGLGVANRMSGIGGHYPFAQEVAKEGAQGGK